MRVLEGAEHVVGEAVEKRPSLVVSPTPVTEEPLSGFDVDRGAVEEFGPHPLRKRSALHLQATMSWFWTIYSSLVRSSHHCLRGRIPSV